MKVAIANAVMTYAQAAGAWRDRDTATIEALRRELRAMSHRAMKTEGALQLIALGCGLPEDTEPARVVAEVQRRIQ